MFYFATLQPIYIVSKKNKMKATLYGFRSVLETLKHHNNQNFA